jgi:hypothetical protein
MIPLGNTVVVSAVIRDKATKALIDPETLRCRVKRRAKDAEETVYVYGTHPELTRRSVGTYELRITPDAPGAWIYRWEGDGPFESAREGTFNIEPSNFG